MKLFYSLTIVQLLLYVNSGVAQTAGIKSGTIYSLQSGTGGKLLDVSNASMENGASIDMWTNTQSDAQRWVVTSVGKGIYTLTNVGSGKLLHAASLADNAKVDQVDSAVTADTKWVIKKAAKGAYYISPAANPALAINLPEGNVNDGTKVNVSKTAATKWIFRKELPQDAAPTAAIAEQIFDAWYTQYGIETGKGFWDQAEMMEIVLDAYEVTKEAKYADRFNKMYEHFIKENKSDWMYNNYNDDITWAVLFSVRGYLLTGNKAYLEKGKEQFDKMYARAFTNSYGGGLIWYETKTSKNACIEGPAMVACCYLAQATGDKTYYDKAIALYSWSKIYLFNAATGKVNDNIDLNKTTGLIRTGTWSSTYNQGTYLGAAVMLYNYTKEKSYLVEAEKIARYARDTMFRSATMDNEDGGNDLPGFKGIFARYARKYTIETNNTDLVDWLRLNAKVAYNNRNSQQLIQTKWATRTDETKPKSAFGASTAVSLLFNLMPLTTIH
ncbi:glycoside hydrolase family 76 protein [Chitinophaga sp.]|uniref:glycoside hydrolase family 76 protein n=1 Tax=Chitinophaga sp. TaxID=1869181 RepID=UPI002F927B07